MSFCFIFTNDIVGDIHCEWNIEVVVKQFITNEQLLSVNILPDSEHV